MYKLLIVDDEFEIRNGLCHFFPWDEVGFQVVGQAESGQKALSFLRSNRVDLVLCDIIMPGMPGLELAKQIQKEFPKVRVCIFTAHKDFSFAQQAISLNVIQYILKSASSSELLNIFRNVRAMLDKQNSQEERPNQPQPAVPAQPAGGHVARDVQIVMEIQNYVRQNYTTVDLNSAADAVHMSANYVSKIFKQNTGQNFSDYVLQVRMEKALELLRNPHYRIYEIGELMGYNYVKNFSRAFRDYYGISPREYRNGKAPLFVRTK